MRRRLFLALSVAALMSLALLSCNRNRQPEKPEPAPAEKEKIKVERVEGLKQIGLTSFELSLVVDNAFRHDISVESGTVTLFYSTSTVCSAELIEKVFVPERSTSTVKVPFTIKLSNPIAAYGVWNKVRRGEIDNISLTFEGRVKVGPVGRNVKTANMPLRDLLKTMGVSDDDLRKLTE